MSIRKGLRLAADGLLAYATDAWRLMDAYQRAADRVFNRPPAWGDKHADELSSMLSSLTDALADLKHKLVEIVYKELPEQMREPSPTVEAALQSLDATQMLVMRTTLWESALTLAPADHADGELIRRALTAADGVLRASVQSIENIGDDAAKATRAALVIMRAQTDGITDEEARRIEDARWIDPVDETE